GHPDYIEQQVTVELRRADLPTRVLGKGCLPMAGEFTLDVLLSGLAAFLAETAPAGVDRAAIASEVESLLAQRRAAAAAVGALPARFPAFCTGCPERPVFSALKLMQRALGPTHISADIGCHSFATFAPFSMGNSILGYGMSLASAAAVGPNLDRRRSPSWAMAASGITASSPASRATYSTRETASSSSCRMAIPRRPGSNSCRRAGPCAPAPRPA